MSQFSVPTVSLIDHRPATTSLAIAEHFEKNHQHVLRDIRNLALECPQDFALSNFGQSSYQNEQGKDQPMYHVFFDGFILLVMGYTGKKALHMKLAYIEAFNAMKAKLEEKQATHQPFLPHFRPSLTPKSCRPAAPVRSDASCTPAYGTASAPISGWARMTRFRRPE